MHRIHRLSLASCDLMHRAWHGEGDVCVNKVPHSAHICRAATDRPWLHGNACTLWKEIPGQRSPELWVPELTAAHLPTCLLSIVNGD
jgi:hypothetical protein